MRTIVYRVGGSLLSLADLGKRLKSLFELPVPLVGGSTGSAPAKKLVVVGGGAIADVVRNWDQVHRLGDADSHDLALRAMSFNARFVVTLLSDAELVADRIEARDVWDRGGIVVLAASEFVDEEEKLTGEQLPRSWDVTSDSIAAYVALHWPADGLVLCKSVPPVAVCDAGAAARNGHVDSYFAQLAPRIPAIAWVNLRADNLAIERWS